MAAISCFVKMRLRVVLKIEHDLPGLSSSRRVRRSISIGSAGEEADPSSTCNAF